MSKPYDLAVVIGRFQPFHNGHLYLLEQAQKQADNILVLVGSSFIARNIKNPFTFDERRQMIRDALCDFKSYVAIAGITDDMYNDQQWVAQVQSEIEGLAEELFPDQENAKIVIVGHTKDASSYYLKMFPGYHYTEVTPVKEINATDIRHQYFGDRSLPKNITDLPQSTVKFMNKFATTSIYTDLFMEYTHIEAYKKQFESLPYPPVFVTCDSVVICMGYILLVKRRSHPGKGTWALPGGFLNPFERIIDGIIRELKEETRIKVLIELLKASLKSVHVFDAPFRSLRGRTITHAGLIILDCKELPDVRGSDDAERAKWVKISDFYQMSEDMFEDHYSIGTYMINRAG